MNLKHKTIRLLLWFIGGLLCLFLSYAASESESLKEFTNYTSPVRIDRNFIVDLTKALLTYVPLLIGIVIVAIIVIIGSIKLLSNLRKRKA